MSEMERSSIWEVAGFRRIAATPDWAHAPSAGSAAAGFGLATLASGLWTAVFIAIGAVAVVFSTAHGAARHWAKNQQDLAHEADIAGGLDYLQNLLNDQIHPLLQTMTEAMRIPGKVERDRHVSEVRMQVLAAAQTIIGISQRTRANIFIYKNDQQGPRFELMRNGKLGRSGQSKRVFRPGDTTYEKTIADESQFEESAGDPELPYETYATHPISTGAGEIFGILTVDSPTSGDLDEERDVSIMAALSDILAMSFAFDECQKIQVPPRPARWCAYTVDVPHTDKAVNDSEQFQADHPRRREQEEGAEDAAD